MSKERTIVGKGLNPEIRREINEFLDITKERGKKSIEGEMPITPENRKFLESANQWIREELRSLGITEYEDFPLERLHFFDHRTYRRRFPSKKVPAFYAGHEGSINIDLTFYAPGRLHFTILHEMIHAASHRKEKVFIEQKKIIPYRTGYQMHPTIDIEHSYFSGLDEAITDRLAYRIIQKHKEKFSGGEFTETTGYASFLGVITSIVERIAQDESETLERVWNRIQRGQFTGDMMHFRRIENIFGPGSLEVLSKLKKMDDEAAEQKMITSVKKYFETNDPAERERIKREIL